MNTAVGELAVSQRTPNALSIQFGRNTNETLSQEYFDRPVPPMAGKPMTEKGSKFYSIDEIHVDAHFDIVQNQGYWLNGNNEKQEINDNDWYNPEPEPVIVIRQQPYNPNLLAITTGLGNGWPEGLSYKKFLIRKVITIYKCTVMSVTFDIADVTSVNTKSGFEQRFVNGSEDGEYEVKFDDGIEYPFYYFLCQDDMDIIKKQSPIPTTLFKKVGTFEFAKKGTDQD